MILSQPLLAACLMALSAAAVELLHPLSDEFIDLINTKQNLWKAGRNFPQSMSLENIKKRLGVISDDIWKKLPMKTHDAELIASLPETFDPRDKWPNCPSLNEIRDQGSCASAWAMAAVAAMTDRICTYSNGTEHFHFSAEDLITCCPDCGLGCDGGMPLMAWMYWKSAGLVSGGNYNSKQGCQPYKIPPCKHYGNTIASREACRDVHSPTPDCVTACQPNYNISYKEDKRQGKHYYPIDIGEDHMKAELYKNGPVQVTFNMYTDFLSYKSGVYKHTHGDKIGGHSVKIMGWGVENGVKYWLAANSWNTDWGDKGFFKILRGVNHCLIEVFILAGEPRLKGK